MGGAFEEDAFDTGLEGSGFDNSSVIEKVSKEWGSIDPLWYIDEPSKNAESVSTNEGQDPSTGQDMFGYKDPFEESLLLDERCMSQHSSRSEQISTGDKEISEESESSFEQSGSVSEHFTYEVDAIGSLDHSSAYSESSALQSINGVGSSDQSQSVTEDQASNEWYMEEPSKHSQSTSGQDSSDYQDIFGAPDQFGCNPLGVSEREISEKSESGARLEIQDIGEVTEPMEKLQTASLHSTSSKMNVNVNDEAEKSDPVTDFEVQSTTEEAAYMMETAHPTSQHSTNNVKSAGAKDFPQLSANSKTRMSGKDVQETSEELDSATGVGIQNTVEDATDNSEIPKDISEHSTSSKKSVNENFPEELGPKTSLDVQGMTEAAVEAHEVTREISYHSSRKRVAGAEVQDIHDTVDISEKSESASSLAIPDVFEPTQAESQHSAGNRRQKVSDPKESANAAVSVSVSKSSENQDAAPTKTKEGKKAKKAKDKDNSSGAVSKKEESQHTARSSDTVKACAVCQATTGKSGAKLLRCSKCKSRWYCSRKCQKKDWKTHKKPCELYLQQKKAASAWNELQDIVSNASTAEATEAFHRANDEISEIWRQEKHSPDNALVRNEVETSTALAFQQQSEKNVSVQQLDSKPPANLPKERVPAVERADTIVPPQLTTIATKSHPDKSLLGPETAKLQSNTGNNHSEKHPVFHFYIEQLPQLSAYQVDVQPRNKADVDLINVENWSVRVSHEKEQMSILHLYNTQAKQEIAFRLEGQVRDSLDSVSVQSGKLSMRISFETDSEISLPTKVSQTAIVNQIVCSGCGALLVKAGDNAEPAIQRVLSLPSGLWDDMSDYLVCFEGQPSVDFTSSSTAGRRSLVLEDDTVLVYHLTDVTPNVQVLAIPGYGEEKDDTSADISPSPALTRGNRNWRDNVGGATVACSCCCLAIGVAPVELANTVRLFKHRVVNSGGDRLTSTLKFCAHSMIRYAESKAVFSFLVRRQSQPQKALILQLVGWDRKAACDYINLASYELAWSRLTKVLFEERDNLPIDVPLTSDFLKTQGDWCCPPGNIVVQAEQKEAKTDTKGDLPTSYVSFWIDDEEWQSLKDDLHKDSRILSREIVSATFMAKTGRLPDSTSFCGLAAVFLDQNTAESGQILGAVSGENQPVKHQIPQNTAPLDERKVSEGGEFSSQFAVGGTNKSASAKEVFDHEIAKAGSDVKEDVLSGQTSSHHSESKALRNDDPAKTAQQHSQPLDKEDEDETDIDEEEEVRNTWFMGEPSTMSESVAGERKDIFESDRSESTRNEQDLSEYDSYATGDDEDPSSYTEDGYGDSTTNSGKSVEGSLAEYLDAIAEASSVFECSSNWDGSASWDGEGSEKSSLQLSLENSILQRSARVIMDVIGDSDIMEEIETLVLRIAPEEVRHRVI